MERQTIFDRLRRTVIGSPLPTSASHEERYSNAEALAILSSDALSSVAYATQEIVLILGMAGAAALSFTLPITGLIVLLMLIVGTSYRQTIKAYPHGGGSYRVSQENIGPLAGLIAGASLSIDYVLTVAVSTAAGIAALTSYFPGLEAQRVPLRPHDRQRSGGGPCGPGLGQGGGFQRAMGPPGARCPSGDP